ncbi:MAG: ABC transporter ATP-binding protein/permease [bacterium]|nr:ABC transporter ATP-binding protein/permease [bacterium]
MIKVEHLQKTYAINKKNETHAINDISFMLPDNGMIFIVGKSGSGKSTLLNILGGLDDFDSGSVIVDGNDLSKMNHSDFNKYRSDYVSFIFQDHFLINELKVKDNIALGLNVINEHDMDIVKDMLDKVDLSNKLDSMPLELSGGERQRVAVARAIIKKPKLILCDEPTGNLDIKTTKLIFDILKDLSKDSLVVVVSHDMDNALIYADRIIEIFGGKILSDKVKNAKYSQNISVDSNNIIIPKNKTIDETDIDYINKNKDLSFKLGEDLFVDNKDVADSNRVVKLNKNKFYKKRITHISKSFVFRSLRRMIITSIIISVIIACFAVFSSLYEFNGNYEIIKKYEDGNVNSMLIRRNYYVNADPGDALRNDDKLYAVSDNDIQKIKDAGYTGNIYKVYNYAISGYNQELLYESYPSNTDNLGSFYAKESYGAISCDEDYLKNKFGSIEVIKGDIYDKKGVIITDYLADSLIKTSIFASSYDDIVGRFQFRTSAGSFVYIKAIIKTNYKEELKEFLEKAERNNGIIVDKSNPVGDEDFGYFCRLIQTKYGLGYTFSTDFLEDNVSDETYGFVPLRYINIEKNGNEFGPVYSFSVAPSSIPLNHGEAIFNVKYFNSIFNENYSVDDLDSFKPITITIKKYYDSSKTKSKDLFGEITIKIVSLYDSKTSHDIFVRPDDFNTFKNVSTIPYGLLLDDAKSTIKCIDNISSDYYISDTLVETVKVLSKYIFIFKKVALLISIILAVLAVLYLAFYEISNVRHNNREIGILKACGMRQRTISIIFIIQQIILSIMVIITAFIFSFILIKVADKLLQTSVETYAKVYVKDITLIRFRAEAMVISLIGIVVVIMTSCIIPILCLIGIKPMNIIKARE